MTPLRDDTNQITNSAQVLEPNITVFLHSLLHRHLPLSFLFLRHHHLTSLAPLAEQLLSSLAPGRSSHPRSPLQLEASILEGNKQKHSSTTYVCKFRDDIWE